MTESVPVEGKTEEHLKERFEKEVLPRLVKEGKFPVDDSKADNLTVADVSWEITERFTDHFASSPYFVRLRITDSSDSTKNAVFPILIKFITQNIATRIAMESDVQFKNEMKFYNEIVPAMREFVGSKSKSLVSLLDDVVPHCYYCNVDEDDIDYAIIVLKDLRGNGFTTAKSKVELDFHHCLTSFQKLGSFHAISYAMKLDDPEKFDSSIKMNWTECRYQEDKFKQEFWGTFFRPNNCRALDYLQNKNIVPQEYLSLLREKVTKDPYKLMRTMMAPNEPLSVLCHGDFCRNNVLYSTKNGIATDCRLFDFQTIRYANPSIDITFFMYMNTTQELREKHFDELISAYHDSLTKTISQITGRPVADVLKLYPLNSFYEDFAENSLWGYVISAFFLPMMMSPDMDEDEFSTLSATEMGEKCAKQGGDVVSERIGGIVKHMYQKKYYL